MDVNSYQAAKLQQEESDSAEPVDPGRCIHLEEISGHVAQTPSILQGDVQYAFLGQPIGVHSLDAPVAPVQPVVIRVSSGPTPAM